MTIVELIRRITRPATLECRPCSNDRGKAVVIDVHHTFYQPASAAAVRTLPSTELRTLLTFSNGLIFFDTDHLPEEQISDNGLEFFSLEEMDDEKARLLETIEQGRESCPEELEEIERNTYFSLDDWYRGFIPIAAPCSSGDLIVMDTFRAEAGLEPRLLFLDHEFYYGGPFDESYINQQWPSLSAFLIAFAADPARMLVSNWRVIFDGNPRNQYVPEKVKYKLD